MPQDADKILDHELLFREPEYQELFRNKKAEFEFNHTDNKIAEIRDWTKTKEYKEKNFARDSLVVNPAKACQPLGAVYVANGFAIFARDMDMAISSPIWGLSKNPFKTAA